MENKKRLLKDLPFENLKAGEVMEIINGKISINHGKTFYKGGGDSDNGISQFNGASEEIIRTVWDNPAWFENVELPEIEIKVERNTIIFDFKPLSMEDAQELAMGIRKCINDKFAEANKGYTYERFNGFNIVSLK